MANGTPELELDERWFTVLARSSTAVIAKHNTSGSLTVWRLVPEWRQHDGNFDADEAAKAWAMYMDAQK